MEIFGPPQAKNFEPLLVLTHPPPGVGGSLWKVLAIRPLRAFFLALSPYVFPLRSANRDRRVTRNGDALKTLAKSPRLDV